MKKFNCLVVIFFLFIACKKDAPDDKTVSGKWEWFKTVGGFYYREFTPQNTGRSWTLILNTDLTYTQSGDYPSSRGWQNTATGTYKLSNVRQINSSRTEGEIIISSFFAGPFIRKSQDTLILDLYSAVDGDALFFVKK